MIRSKTDQRVYDLAKILPELNEKQRSWVWRSLFKNEAHATKKGEGWCSNCGEVFECSIDAGNMRCPNCGEALPVIHSQQTTANEKFYVTSLCRIEEWQVVRHFIAEKRVRKGLLLRKRIVEVCQEWINENGKRVINALPLNGLSMYYDAWNLGAKLGIKNEYRGCYKPNPYRIFAPIIPGGSILPRLRRNGYTRRCDMIPVGELMQQLLTNNNIETLIKQGQYDVIKFLYNTHYGKYMEIRQSVNICTRQGYTIKDAQLWVDYLELLRYFGKDILSPRYICPQSLKAEHDRLYRKKAGLEWEAQERRRLAEQRQRSADYKKRIADYVGIVLDARGLHARVLKDVEDFYNEGEAMNHCVYANEYDKKESSLIFSVRNDSGKRVATVEYDIYKQAVVQCRAKNNSRPKRYEDILEMFKKIILNDDRKAAVSFA